MFERYRIVIAFEADRDSVPGWGHQPEDWIKLATANFQQQSHYNTKFEVLSIEQRRKIYVEGTGYVNPDFADPAQIDKEDKTQRRIAMVREFAKQNNPSLETLIRLDHIADEYDMRCAEIAAYKSQDTTKLVATLRDIYNKPEATVDDLIELVKQTAKDTDDLVAAEFGSDDED